MSTNSTHQAKPSQNQANNTIIAKSILQRKLNHLMTNEGQQQRFGVYANFAKHVQKFHAVDLVLISHLWELLYLLIGNAFQ